MFGLKMLGVFLPGFGIPELIILMVIFSIIALPVITAVVIGKAADSKGSKPSGFGSFCPRCGKKSDEGANFCIWRGARLS